MSNFREFDVFDPDYCAPDASLVLISTDGIKFRVYSNIMAMASGIFKDMLENAEDTGEPIWLQETSIVIKALLDMINPDGLLFVMDDCDFDFVWTLLLAADKYEMHKVMDEFRIRLLSDIHFLNKLNPLESYTIAAHFGWKAEMSATMVDATEYLNATNSWRTLARIDSIHVLQLFGLIELRKLKLLNDIRTALYHGFYDLWDPKFTVCSATADHIDSERFSAGTTFLSFVELEFQKSPSGITLRGSFWNKPEVKWLFSLNGLRNAKIIILSALDGLPCSSDDISKFLSK